MRILRGLGLGVAVFLSILAGTPARAGDMAPIIDPCLTAAAETETPTSTDTSTNTPAATATATNAATATFSPTPTDTATATATFTPVDTPTFTPTFTPVIPTDTPTFTPTFTPVPATDTPTFTPGPENASRGVQGFQATVDPCVTHEPTTSPTDPPPTAIPTDQPVIVLPATGEGATGDYTNRGIILMLGGIATLIAATWIWTREQSSGK